MPAAPADLKAIFLAATGKATPAEPAILPTSLVDAHVHTMLQRFISSLPLKGSPVATDY
jgi:hypothetical protein